MFNNKKRQVDLVGEYQEQRKILPYTVTNSDKGAAMRFNNEVDLRNAKKAFDRRQSAMAAFNTGSGNRVDVRDSGRLSPIARYAQHIESPDTNIGRRVGEQPNTVYTSNKSLISRIYNWFLNINY